jgi:hypothetical protein
MHGQCHTQPPQNISNDKDGLTLLRLGDRSSLITTLNFQAVFYASVSALPRARKTNPLTAQELFHSCYTAKMKMDDSILTT